MNHVFHLKVFHSLVGKTSSSAFAEQSICAVLHAAHTLLATYSTTKQQRAAGKIGNQVFKMKLVCCEELGSTRDSLPVLNPLARKMNLILLTQMTFEALSHK